MSDWLSFDELNALQSNYRQWRIGQTPSLVPAQESDWEFEKKKWAEAGEKAGRLVGMQFGLSDQTGFIGKSLASRFFDIKERIPHIRPDIGRYHTGHMIERQLKNDQSGALKSVPVDQFAGPEFAGLYPKGTTLEEAAKETVNARGRLVMDTAQTINLATGPISASVGDALRSRGVSEKTAFAVEMAIAIAEPGPNEFLKAGPRTAVSAAEQAASLNASKIASALQQADEMAMPALARLRAPEGSPVVLGVEMRLRAAAEKASEKGIQLDLDDIEEARRLLVGFYSQKPSPTRIARPEGPVSRGSIVKPGPELGKVSEPPKRIVVAQEGEKALQRGMDVHGGTARVAAERQKILATEAQRKAQRMGPAQAGQRWKRGEPELSESQFNRLMAQREAERGVEAQQTAIRTEQAKAGEGLTARADIREKQAEEIAQKQQYHRDLKYHREGVQRMEEEFLRKLPKEGEKFRARDLKVMAKPLRDRLEVHVKGGAPSRAERQAMTDFQMNQLPKVRERIKKVGLNPDDYFPKSYLLEVKTIGAKKGGRQVANEMTDGLSTYVTKRRFHFAPGGHHKGKTPGELTEPLSGEGILKVLTAKEKGKGLAPDDMIQDLREKGYPIPEDANEYDLYAMFVEDHFYKKQTGRSKFYSAHAQDSIDDALDESFRTYAAGEEQKALFESTQAEDIERWIGMSKKEVHSPRFTEEIQTAMESLTLEQERIAARLSEAGISPDEVKLLKARNKKIDRALTRMEAVSDVDESFDFGMNLTKKTPPRPATGQGIELPRSKAYRSGSKVRIESEKGGRISGVLNEEDKTFDIYRIEAGEGLKGHQLLEEAGDYLERHQPGYYLRSHSLSVQRGKIGQRKFTTEEILSGKAEGVSASKDMIDFAERQVKRGFAYHSDTGRVLFMNATDRLDREAARMEKITDTASKIGDLGDDAGFVAGDLLVPAAARKSARGIREMMRVVYFGGIRSLDSTLGSLGKLKSFDESVRLRMRHFQERLHSYEKYVETNAMREIAAFRNTVKNLTDDEWAELVEVLDKKGGTNFPNVDNEKIRFAAQRIRAILDRVAEEAEPNGVLIGKRKAYFPHRFTKEQLNSEDFIREMAEHSGISEAEAAEMVNKAIKNRKGARIAYNLERERELYHPGFRKDRAVLEEYLMESYSRVGQARYFSNKVIQTAEDGTKKVRIPPGGENAIAERFINSMPNRYLKSIINMGFNQVINADISALEPILRPLRYLNAITLLSTSAVAQVGQVTHLIAEAGLLRTAQGLRDMLADMDVKQLARWQEWNGRIFTRAWRQDAKRAFHMMTEPMKEPSFRSAALWPNIRQEVGRAAGKETGWLWGLPTADMYLRVLSDRVGRRTLESLAKAGDVDGLKLLGKEVGMDLTGVRAGRGLLSSAEADAVGRWISNWTQFRTDPLHMPVGFNHELGKTVFQFMSFMRQHSRYTIRTLKELGVGGAPGVRKRAAKRIARFLVMGAVIGEGIADLKAVLKGYGLEGEDISDRNTWEKLERALYTRRISFKNPVYRILQNYSILGGVGIFQMLLENMVRPGSDISRFFGISAELVERLAYRPIKEAVTEGPAEGAATFGREAVSRIPHVGYQLQREAFPREGQGMPTEPGLVGRLFDYWNPERAELRELTKIKEQGQRKITALRRQRGEKEEPELTYAGKSQKLRRQIHRQGRTTERERLLNLMHQARERKDYRSYRAVLRRAKMRGFRIAEE